LIHAYGKVRIDDIDQVKSLDKGRLIGAYIGWAYPPEKWRPAPLEGSRALTPEEVPVTDESEATETELRNIQTAVRVMMLDNRLTELPNPVTSPTNDMSLFPDTSVCEIDKLRDWDGNPYVHGQDKDGYLLYQHDLIAKPILLASAWSPSLSHTSPYVTIQYTIGTYIVDSQGTVTQVTIGYE